jgi:hypothetical protein
MKIISMLRRLLERRKASRGDQVDCTRQPDPLDHPTIKRMSLLELADLPFVRCEERK